jgi:hypothetical protein
LELLAFFKRAHKQETTYQVWEEGNHPQIIKSEAVMRQKLDYIHTIPSSGATWTSRNIGAIPVRVIMPVKTV